MRRNGGAELKLVQYCNSVSPHQLPLAHELLQRVGATNYRYVATNSLSAGRVACGWSEVKESWISYGAYGEDAKLDVVLENCEVLLTGIRELGLFEKRARKGLGTLYMSERWFKPVRIVRLFRLFDCSIPGWVRMLVPSYRRMVKRFVRWMNSDPNARCLAIGPWAKKDMLRMGIDESKIVPWGYFVAPSNQRNNLYCQPQPSTSTSSPLKVLWVGRMLHWKRVDTIIRAVAEVGKRGVGIQLTIVGDGPEKPRLQSLANRTIKQSNNRTIVFVPSQPIDKIREIMRSHDVYVLASNAQEGWGAALNEALEEGMFSIGTFDAGASATMLSPEWMFHSGNWHCLADLIVKCGEMKKNGVLLGQGIGEWSASRAAERLLTL